PQSIDATDLVERYLYYRNEISLLYSNPNMYSIEISKSEQTLKVVEELIEGKGVHQVVIAENTSLLDSIIKLIITPLVKKDLQVKPSAIFPAQLIDFPISILYDYKPDNFIMA